MKRRTLIIILSALSLLVAAVVFLFYMLWSGMTYTPPPKDTFFAQKRNAAGVRMVQVDVENQVWTQKLGSGSIPLLLLHGGPGATHEYFENFPEYLDTTIYTIYFYDQLGSFYSDNPNSLGMWKLDRFVNDVESVRKALDLKDFYLLGHSWGGLLAIEYASQHGDQLKGLVLSNTPFTDYGANKYRQLLWENAEKELLAQTGEEPTGKAIKQEFERIHRYGLDTIPAVFQRLIKHYNLHPRKSRMYNYSRFWSSLEGKAETLQMPVLIIGGEKDFVDPRDFELLHQHIPNSELVIIPDAPHFPMWSQPGAYFQSIDDFIDQRE